jgi:hypothetical protein
MPRVAPATTPFEQAQAAFMSHDLAGAETAYRAVLAADTVAAHRREATTTLAAIAWRVRGDTASAGRVLAEAATTPWGRFAALLERARMQRESGNYAAARAAAGEAEAAAATEAERDEATESWAAATLEPLLRETGRAPDRAALRHVIARLDSLVQRSPGRLEPARLLILAGALASDVPALFAGWRSYYLIETGDTLTGLLAEPRRRLREAADAAVAGRGPSPRRRAMIVHALADSRLFAAAAVVALAPGTGGSTLAARDPHAREIVAYASFLDSVTRVTDQYYRETALGKGSKDSWLGAVDAAARALWPRLVWAGPPPRFSLDSAPPELDRRFGAVVNLGETAGYQDLHFGHRVLDERRTVQQYGHTGSVRFVALDAIVSNGFQSWAWDGRAQHGGWGNKELIVQIRPAYVDSPVRAWREVTEPTTVRRIADEIRADSVADLSRSRETPVAYFPSVAGRLRRDGLLALLNSLRGAGYTSLELETAFERELGAAMLESSIFAHEGRHAIDDGLGIDLSSEEREYRAKLSEIAFASHPKVNLGGIISSNAGDDTPHGKANLRVMQGLDRWMRGHASEIARLDASAPLLPQLPLLTDAQLKAAFASLDPLAHEARH